MTYWVSHSSRFFEIILFTFYQKLAIHDVKTKQTLTLTLRENPTITGNVYMKAQFISWNPFKGLFSTCTTKQLRGTPFKFQKTYLAQMYETAVFAPDFRESVY